MRLVFVGSAAFAVPTLRALVAARHEVALVVTQPDRPGHRLRLAAPPVKSAAVELGLDVFQPERVRSADAIARIGLARPELMVVVAYGQIIPRALLDLPVRGAVNVHASLLPRHRGAAPVAAAILAGDEVTGVTIMAVDELLDHGPVLARRATPIGPEEDAEELAGRLAALGALVLVETLARFDEIEPVEQDHAAATVAGKLRREDGDLDWGLDAGVIDRHVRAFQPWPGVTLPWAGGRVKVLQGSPAGGAGRPGELLGAGPDGIEVACGRGSYRLRRVQLPGRRPMSAAGLVGAHA